MYRAVPGRPAGAGKPGADRRAGHATAVRLRAGTWCAVRADRAGARVVVADAVSGQSQYAPSGDRERPAAGGDGPADLQRPTLVDLGLADRRVRAGPGEVVRSQESGEARPACRRERATAIARSHLLIPDS